MISALTLLAIYVGVIVLPIPIKALIGRHIYHHDYEPSSDAIEYDEVNRYAHYAAAPDKRKRRLCVLFVGGAFMFANLRTHLGLANLLYETIGKTHDLLVVSYRTRFLYTIRDSMLSLNETLSRFLDYDEYCAIGVSAGALLAGAFARKESDEAASRKMNVPRIGMTFERLVGICGVYSVDFGNDLLNAVFRYYVMRHTPSPKSYDWRGLSRPMMLVSVKRDILHGQTLALLASESARSLIFSKPLSHAFAQMTNLPETVTTVREIAKFLTEKRNDA